MKIMTRRNALYAALIAAAVSTAITTASAIATGAPMLATTTAETVQTVSPRMAELVANYQAALEQVDTLAPDTMTDSAAWAAVEAVFVKAQAELLAERPKNAADFAAKFDALIELDAGEGGFDAFKTLSEDAHALAGAR